MSANSHAVSSSLMHEPVLAQAERTPGRPAVITPVMTLSYAELVGRSLAVAQALRAHGMPERECVAVAMHRGWEQVVAVLGTHLAGGVYVPVDPEWPAARIEQVLGKAEIRHVLTQSWLMDAGIWPGASRCVAVDHVTAAESPERPALSITPEDLAYVIFTSGTTGSPKGVMINHLGAVNTIVDINRRFEVTAADRVLSLSALHFDLSVYDIYGLLAVGGCVVMPEHAQAKHPAHWVELVLKHGVTLWNTVPALMGLLCEQAAREQPVQASALAASLRLVMMSGDWIPVTLPGRIASLFPHAAIQSLGGATEASIWSIGYPIREVPLHWKSIPYGRALDGQTVEVLDAALQPCPVGQAGDIYIGGIGLALGYLGDAERTAAAFITHPAQGVRLYRTGDQGRLMADSHIEFLGRNDTQVKINGYRVELEEIEAVLLRRPEALRAAVVMRRDSSGHDRLYAFVVPQQGLALSEAEWLEHLRERLPAYMVPARLFTIAALPTTSNDKVDRGALAVPQGADAAKPHVAPRSEAERLLAGVWGEVLGRDDISVDDNYFQLGGDSIAAIRIASRVAEQGFQLSVELLYAHPSVAELAPQLRPKDAQATAPAAAPAVAATDLARLASLFGGP